MKRSADFRYTVLLESSELTPLAEVEAYLGPKTLKVLNISSGGFAFLAQESLGLKEGDLAAVSLLIRGRAYPVQVQIRALKGQRIHSAFVNPPPAFTTALREFLKPKFLGGSLKYHPALSHREDVLSLVPQAKIHEAFIGQNQSAVFVWLNERRHILRLLGVVKDLVFEWTPQLGVRTGRLLDKEFFEKGKEAGQSLLPAEPTEEEIRWSEHEDVMMVHYFTDIFIPWLHNNVELVEKLIHGPGENLESQPVVFPKLY